MIAFIPIIYIFGQSGLNFQWCFHSYFLLFCVFSQFYLLILLLSLLLSDCDFKGCFFTGCDIFFYFSAYINVLSFVLPIQILPSLCFPCVLVSVLVCLGYCNKNIIAWVVSEQQTFTSYSSGGWSPVKKIKAPEDLLSVRDLSCVSKRLSLHCVLTRALWGLFHKDTNPIMGALVSWPHHLPKAPSPNTITLGERTQHMDFWAETQHLVHCGLSLSWWRFSTGD